MGKRLEKDTELEIKQNKKYRLYDISVFILLKYVWTVMERNEDNNNNKIYVPFVHCVKNCVNRKSRRYRLIIASGQRVKIK